MSLRASTGCPSICSGDMYWNVPTQEPSAVSGRDIVKSADALPGNPYYSEDTNPRLGIEHVS